MAKLQRSLYDGAPGMLMDRIHEVNILLIDAKNKNGETDSWRFWTRTCDIMKFSWDYMQNLNWVMKENTALKLELEYVREALAKEREVNLCFTTLMQMKLDGTFEQRNEIVDMFIEKGWDKKEGIFRD